MRVILMLSLSIGLVLPPTPTTFTSQDIPPTLTGPRFHKFKPQNSKVTSDDMASQELGGIQNLNSNQSYNKNRLLVSLKYKPEVAGKLSLFRSKDFKLVQFISYSPLLNVAILDCRSTLNCKNVHQKLMMSNSVDSISFDRHYEITRVPNDPKYESLWGLQAINAPNAWNRTSGSENVIVAVIDTGVDLQHPDLSDNIWMNTREIADNNIDDDNNGYVDDVRGWDFIDDDNNPDDVVIPGVWGGGHGTHVAGTIAASGDNNIGVTGVSWKSKVMPLRVCSEFGACYMSDVLAALQYAYINGAQVANLSLGGAYEADEIEFEIIRSIGVRTTGLKKGVLVVAAAGNSSSDNETYPIHPANYRVPNLISVAASDLDSKLALFSNYSVTNVDVAAPGVDILSTIPLEGAFNQSGDYGTLSGTSMATPHVAGVAALVLSRNSSWEVTKVRKVLMASTVSKDSLNNSIYTGGIIDASLAVNNNGEPKSSLVIRQVGTGLGIVKSNSATTCEVEICRLPLTKDLELLAEPQSTSTFYGWADSCSDALTLCRNIQESSNPIATARFDRESGNSVAQSSIAASVQFPTFEEDTQPDIFNFTNIRLSANGETRAKAVFRYHKGHRCYFETSETGGITIESQVNGEWVEEAHLQTPSLDEQKPEGRVANCFDFGKNMELSDDGNTLVVNLDVYFELYLQAPQNDYIICGFAVYKRNSDGSWNDPEIVLPDDRSICLEIASRTESEIWLWNTKPTLTMSSDGKFVFFAGNYGKIEKYSIENETTLDSLIQLPGKCKLWSDFKTDLHNLATDEYGSVLALSTHACTSIAGDSSSMVITHIATSPKFYSPANPKVGYFIKSVWSKDSKYLALSYNDYSNDKLGSGVILFSHSGEEVTYIRDIESTSQQETHMACHRFVKNNTQLICDSRLETVGRNKLFGTLIIYHSLTPDWKSDIWNERFWVKDYVQSKNSWHQQLFSDATDDGSIIETSIHGYAMSPKSSNKIGTRFELKRLPQVNGKPQIAGAMRVNSTIELLDFDIYDFESVLFEWFSCKYFPKSEESLMLENCTLQESTVSPKLTLTGKFFDKYIVGRILLTNKVGQMTALSMASNVRVEGFIADNPEINWRRSSNFIKLKLNSYDFGYPRPEFSYQWFECKKAISSRYQKLPPRCRAMKEAKKARFRLKDLPKHALLRIEYANRYGTNVIFSETISKGTKNS